jgi:hypothetical protein
MSILKPQKCQECFVVEVLSLERQKHKLKCWGIICHHILSLLLSNTLYCFPCFSLLVVHPKLQPQIIMKYEGFMCRNPSLGLTTKARACKVAGQEGSLGVTFHAPRGAKKCEGMNPHIPMWTPILGIRLPNFQREIVGVKTHWIEVFLISLKTSQQGLQLCFKPHFNQRFACKIMGPQSCWSPNLKILGLPLGSPGTKCHLDVGPVVATEYIIKGKVVASPKSRSWWVLWVRVCPWLVLTPIVLQLCTNQLIVWFCAGPCEWVSACHSS